MVFAQLGLISSLEVNKGAPAGFLYLLALGVLFFAAGSWGLGMKRAASGKPIRDGISATIKPVLPTVKPFGIAGILAGTLAAGLLLVALAAGSQSGYLLLPWIFALLAFAIPFVPRVAPAAAHIHAGTREFAHRYLPDALIVLGLMALFLGLAVLDLRDWYYSAIGDEFLFYEHARRIVEEGIIDPFSQEGVYNKYPVMTSVYQATAMRMFGVDYFGWTFSEALYGIITIPGIYLLGHTFAGRKAALFSAALFACSHYILAQSHVGYGNLSPLPVSVWSIALFALGWRSGNPLTLYAAGIVAGLGFYSHYSGRAILPVLFLFTLTSGGPRRLPDMWPVAFGFALAVAPTFVVEREQVFTRMFSEVVGGYTEVVAGAPFTRILSNIELNLPAFNYNSNVHSYVYGPLLDPVTSVLAVLGIGFALTHIHLRHFRLLLIWFGVAMVVTGVLSPYPHVAITRLTFALPPLVLLAGTSASHLIDTVQARWTGLRRMSTESVAVVAFLVLFPAILALNSWQHWHVTPSIYAHTPEAVALGAFRSQPCDGDLNGTVFIGPAVGEGSLMNQVVDSFRTEGPPMRGLNHSEIAPDLQLPDLPPRCIVFLDPYATEAVTLQERLTRQYPDGRISTFANPSGSTAVAVFATGNP